MLTQKMATAQALALAGGSLKKPRGGGPGGAGTIGRKLAARRAAAGGVGDPMQLSGGAGEQYAAAASSGSGAFGGPPGGYTTMGMTADGMPGGMDGYLGMTDSKGGVNLALLQQAAAAAATDAARMTAQHQASQQAVQQQASGQYAQQQMYGKGMDGAQQQQYALNELLAGLSSSGFPAGLGQQGMQSAQQQYPTAELLASLGYSDPAAAAAMMSGLAGGPGQQLQEGYYMQGNPAAAGAAAYMQEPGMGGGDFGPQMGDFAQQGSGLEERGSHAGGYAQVRHRHSAHTPCITAAP